MGYSYKKNCLYIEDHSNVFVDNEIYCEGIAPFHTMLSAYTKRTKSEINDTINLLHEINHYLHDMSVMACIVQGQVLDYLAACCKDLSQVIDIRFPLFNKDNFEWNHQLELNKEQSALLIFTDKMYKIYDFLFVQKHIKPNKVKYSFGYADKIISQFGNFELSNDYILETYAYHKAYWDIFLFCSEDDNIDLIHEVTKENHVYPYIFRNGQIIIENYKRYIEWNKPYQLLNLLFLISINGEWNEDYVNYCETRIPYGYKDSPAILPHSSYKIIIETALNIPSIDYIYNHYDDEEDLEQFSPVHRIWLIIKAIRDNKGYPKAIDGESFFKTFHNWVSKIYNWLSYDDTLETILSTQCHRIKYSEEVISNFQLTLLSQKMEHIGKFVQDYPTNILSYNCMPIIINNQKGFIFNVMYGNSIIPSCGMVNPYSSFFGEIIKYKTINGVEDASKRLAIMMENNKGYLREIINRLFSYAVLQKGLNGDINTPYRCPFYFHGCPYSCNTCREFHDFKEVLNNCQKNILRKNNLKFYIGNNQGNTEDCMFYNYMIDSQFNI